VSLKGLVASRKNNSDSDSDLKLLGYGAAHECRLMMSCYEHSNGSSGSVKSRLLKDYALPTEIVMKAHSSKMLN
jgi:hypothetical protein